MRTHDQGWREKTPAGMRGGHPGDALQRDLPPGSTGAVPRGVVFAGRQRGSKRPRTSLRASPSRRKEREEKREEKSQDAPLRRPGNPSLSRRSGPLAPSVYKA